MTVRFGSLRYNLDNVGDFMGLCCYIFEKDNPKNSINLGKMYGYVKPDGCDKFDSLLLLIRVNRYFYEYLLDYISDGNPALDYTIDNLYDAALHLFENDIHNTDALFPFDENDYCSIDGFVMQYLNDYVRYGFLPQTASDKLNEYFEIRKSIKPNSFCVSFS